MRSHLSEAHGLEAEAEDAEDAEARARSASFNLAGTEKADPAPVVRVVATPRWAWIAVVVAVISCSSGGVWFALLPPECPRVLRASWRLQFTFALQIPGFVLDWRRANAELRRRWRSSLLSMAFVGAVLAGHFGAWSESLAYTSLSHSLLFVTTTPILLVMYSGLSWMLLGWLRTMGCTTRTLQPPTWLEVTGAFVGLGAAAILASETGTTSSGPLVPPSVQGDALALLGAAFMGVYLTYGFALRQWMPVWLYVAPVTAVAALVSALFSLAVEGATLQGNGLTSVFGDFALDQNVFLLVLGSAVTAGILGHTAANLAMQYVSPLTVSILLLWEPLIGSAMGFLCHVQGPPSLVTYLAGFPLMLSAVLVLVGKRESAAYVHIESWLCCCHLGSRCRCWPGSGFTRLDGDGGGG
jgi:drug/metabolite transporter (DMT)-like permease